MSGVSRSVIENNSDQGSGPSLNPADALAVIQYLDVLRDRLWSDYGDAIAAEYSAERHGNSEDVTERQIDLEFEDSIPF